jgi:hypothetical protein
MPTEMIQRIIDETLARFGRDATYDDYRAVAFELFAEEMRALAASFTRQGFIKWIKSGLRSAANVDESDPHAVEVQLDLLPGLPAPGYLNIGNDFDPKLVRVQDSTVQDWEVCIEKRHRVARRITARAEDMAQKLEWFKAHIRTDDETLGACLSRVMRSSRTSDDDQPTAVP